MYIRFAMCDGWMAIESILLRKRFKFDILRYARFSKNWRFTFFGHVVKNGHQ